MTRSSTFRITNVVEESVRPARRVVTVGQVAGELQVAGLVVLPLGKRIGRDDQYREERQERQDDTSSLPEEGCACARDAASPCTRHVARLGAPRTRGHARSVVRETANSPALPPLAKLAASGVNASVPPQRNLSPGECCCRPER